MVDHLQNTSWLNFEYLGNRVYEYLAALIGFFVLSLILYVFKFFVLHRLDAALAKRNSLFAGFISEFSASIRPSFLVLVALYLSLQRLQLHSRVERITDMVVIALLTFVATSILAKLVRYLILNSNFGGLSHRNDLSLRSARLNLSALATVALWIAGVLFYLSNLGVNITTFVTGLGIGGIAIALAAQSLLGDLFSSFTIALDKPFEVGDSIQLDNQRGNVEHIGLKTTRLRLGSGESLIIPNSDLTRNRIRNYRGTKSWRVQNDFSISHAASLSHLQAVPGIIEAVINEHNPARLDRIALLNFRNGSFNFDLTYYVDTQQESTVYDLRQKINYRMLEQFENAGIKLALPAQQIITNSI